MTDIMEPTRGPTLSQLLTSDPEIMSGMVVFRGTRVPVETLFDNLADGLTLDEILDEFPTLDRADLIAVLSLIPNAIAASAEAA